MKRQPTILSLDTLRGTLEAYSDEIAARRVATILRDGRAAVLQCDRVDWRVLLVRTLGPRGAISAAR